MSDSVWKVLGNLSSNSRGAVDLTVKVGMRMSAGAEGMDFRAATLAAEREETNRKTHRNLKVDEMADKLWRLAERGGSESRNVSNVASA